MIFELAFKGASLGIHEDQFHTLLERHLTRLPQTRSLQDLAHQIRLDNANNVESIIEFLERLAPWGGPSGWRNLGHMRSNSNAVLVSTFKRAIGFLNVHNFAKALKAFDSLFGIGPTYASKCVRFFDPQNCVALDSKLCDRLRLKHSDYLIWRQRCFEIAQILDWPAADVEAATYEYVIDGY